MHSIFTKQEYVIVWLTQCNSTEKKHFGVLSLQVASETELLSLTAGNALSMQKH